MRIGIEAQRIFREKKHGIDFVALELIKNLPVKENQEFIVFVNAHPKDVDYTIQQNVRFVTCKLPYPVWEQIWLPYQIKKHRLDAIHCTANTFPLFSSAPKLLTLHDIIFMESNPLKNKAYSSYQKWGNAYRRLLVKYGLRSVKKIITVSEFELNNLQANLKVTSKGGVISKVYNGVSRHFNSSKLTMAEKEQLTIKYRLPQQFMLFLGNSDPKKNTPNTIKAFASFAEFYPQAHLVVGDLEPRYLKACLAKNTAADILERIIPVGYIDNKDLPGIIKLSQCFLYPSRRESFGIPLLEAMCCGIPVLTSNTSSMPEVANGAALLVDPENVNQMATQMEQVWGDGKLRNDLIQKGLERSKAFSWTRMAKEYSNIYTQVA